MDCDAHRGRRLRRDKTFNRCFDAMFREDCRDTAGHLQHVCKGKLCLRERVKGLSEKDLIDWGDVTEIQPLI